MDDTTHSAHHLHDRVYHLAGYGDLPLPHNQMSTAHGGIMHGMQSLSGEWHTGMPCIPKDQLDHDKTIPAGQEWHELGSWHLSQCCLQLVGLPQVVHWVVQHLHVKLVFLDIK